MDKKLIEETNRLLRKIPEEQIQHNFQPAFVVESANFEPLVEAKKTDKEIKEGVIDLEDQLDELAEKLLEAVDLAKDAQKKAEEIGGEVARVVAGQLQGYLIPHVRDFAEDDRQTGSVAHLKEYLSNEDDYLKGEEDEEAEDQE